MNVLLTGGAGFIGSHTAVALAAAGHRVILADNFSNSDPSVLRQLERLTGQSMPCYAVDIADRAAAGRVFEENSIDAVIHFAGHKAVGESVRQPLRYYRNNLDSTLTLLELMARHGCRRIIFSSSAAVYGAGNPAPLTEDMPAGRCANPYGRTKYFIEEILRDAAAADPALSVVLLRYFNPIGAHESGLIGERPNGEPNNLMPYITQTAAGLLPELRIYGGDYPTPDGTGVRDYIHICDLAAGHVAALRYVQEHAGTEVFNLGTGRGASVLEVVHAFERATGIRVPYKITSRRPGDVAVCYASVDKAARVLHWQAEKSLEDMCRDAWRWQRQWMTGENGHPQKKEAR